jgi:PBP1b-binding outer membrane lipoprotein LpoB
MNMKMKAVKTGVLIFLAALLITGCSKQPTQEVNDAKSAIDSAVQAGAEKYAKDELNIVKERFSEAMAEIKAQDEKFFKNYDKAKLMLEAVKKDAVGLKDSIARRKEEAKNAAMNALDAAKASIADAKKLLAKVPKVKTARADVDSLKSEIKGIEGTFVQVTTSMNAEDYLGASKSAKAISAKAARVSEKIKKLTEKLKKKPVKRESVKKTSKKKAT